MDYVFSNNDLIFNNYNFKNLVNVEKVEMSLLPQLDNISQRLPGKPGSLFRKNKLGNREINIYCRLIRSSKKEVFNARRILAEMLYTDKPKVLKFRNEKNLYYNAILDGEIKFVTSRKSAELVLKFIAHDPLGYSDEIIIKGSGSKVNFNYLGSYETSAVVNISLKSSSSEFVLVDEITKSFVKIRNNFSNDTKVKIDCIKQLIEVNSEKSMNLLDYDSDFLEVRKGENRWSFSQNVDYEIRFQERWL